MSSKQLVPVLCVFAALYTVAYLSAPDLPGSFEAPLGWWGYTDQGLYLKSAKAFAHLNFNPSEHWYPPLYSLFAAPFAYLMPVHAFFLPDLVCFLITSATFLYIASEYMPVKVGVILFLATISIPWILAPDWIIPWTSSLSAALVSLLLLACTNDEFARGLKAPFAYALFGVLAGSIILVRPLEIVLGIILCAYVFFRSLRGLAKDGKPSRQRLVVLTGLMASGGVLGPIVFLIFNYEVYHSVFSPYMIVSAEAGYDLSTIPQKFVSVFITSEPLFLVNGQTFIAKYPWLIITFAMLPAIIGIGTNILRLVAGLGSVHSALYLAYSDMFPRNLYLYHTIHYFKLWLPYFALLATLGLWLVLKNWKTKLARSLLAVGIVFSAVMWCIGFSIHEIPLQAERSGNRLELTGTSETIGFIELNGVDTSSNSAYTDGNNLVRADGQALRRLGDYHLFKTLGGTRLFFTSPRAFHRLSVALNDKFTSAENTSAKAYTWRIGLRWPF